MEDKWTIVDGELYHHGILGQRWGVKNGPPYPLDPAKKKRLKNYRENRPQNKVKTLSDRDLDEAINRLEKERRYVELSKRNGNLSVGQNIVENLLLVAGTTFITTLFNESAAKAGRGIVAKMVEKGFGDKIFRALYAKK